MRLLLIRYGALLLGAVVAALAQTPTPGATPEPFLTQLDSQTWVIGNDVWNMTQQRTYGVKLMYKGKDLVGSAVGHYVSYNGRASNLNFTSATIVARGSAPTPFINVRFSAREGDMHWVVWAGQHGAHQYFVNRALPPLGEFRTLWRLDNGYFTHGRTELRDGALPPLRDFVAANRVQDETWRRPDGRGYITKYDLADWLRRQRAYGVYGSELKQELMVHRESETGDAVLLNMIHGTHFQAGTSDVFKDGKMWGPWLWYLNNGSIPDALARASTETPAWPYPWLQDPAYQSRGSVYGRLILSDGRPAAHAAVFLGDDNSTRPALDQGAGYYYTGATDGEGRFALPHVRAGVYALQAWADGGALADVSTAVARGAVAVAAGEQTELGELVWAVDGRVQVFRVGDFDRTAVGFRFGGAPYEHGLVDKCPADLRFTVGRSEVGEWCFGQTRRGNWTIAFQLPEERGNKTRASLIVSLAGYSSGASATIWANGKAVGNMTSGSSLLRSDPSLYRSATAAGEWNLLEFGFDAGLLSKEENEIRFELTRNKTWSGFMYDSIILAW